MLTVVVVLIGVLVVLRIASAVRDRQLSTRGVDLSAETMEDRMYAANRTRPGYTGGVVFTDPGPSGGSLWYDGGGGDFGGGDSGGDGDSGSSGDFGGGGDSGGGGDFGGGDSG